MSNDFVKTVNDAGGRVSALTRALVAGGSSLKGKFLLLLGSTHTSDIPGISAAGASPELRRLTPKIDAEVLCTGLTTETDGVPVSPHGIVSPVVITRACAELAGLNVSVLDCGSFVTPDVPCRSLGSQAARCLSSGRALELMDVEVLFFAGLEIGRSLSDECDYAVIGECVPGGTTTALAVLSALGYKVDGLMSSSLPQSNHDVRQELVELGLKQACIKAEQAAMNPLIAVAAVGDPMQPVAAGILLGSQGKLPIVMAGGSQMLAVWALARDLACASKMKFELEVSAVVTTKWVAFDGSAGTARLAELVDAPLAAACPDFHGSKHAGLRAYEDGNVKEGVGAGGAMAVAHLAGGASGATIVQAIDCAYDQIVLRERVLS